jgi:hypothetical protein
LPELVRHMDGKLTDSNGLMVMRGNRRFRRFLRFIFSSLTGLRHLVLEHEGPPCNSENGFHHYYDLITSLIRLHGHSIETLAIIGAPQLPQRQTRLMEFVAACSPGLHLILDDFNKFATCLKTNRCLPVRRLDMSKFAWPFSIYAPRLFLLFPDVELIRMSIDFRTDNGFLMHAIILNFITMGECYFLTYTESSPILEAYCEDYVPIQMYRQLEDLAWRNDAGIKWNPNMIEIMAPSGAIIRVYAHANYSLPHV